MPPTIPEPLTAANLFAQGTVTVAGLKTEYGIGRTTAYELISTGKLAHTKIGRRVLIPRAAVVALLREGLVGFVEESI